MSSPHVHPDAPFAVATLAGPEGSVWQLLWGHGWGQSLQALLPLAQSLQPFAPSRLIDFPGFGQSPKPDDSWGTAEYADQVAAWLRTLPPSRFIWIGHSFGGRVGVQLAARHPELLAGMILIAAAGIPRPRTWTQQAKLAIRRQFFRTAKRLLPEGPQLDRLRQRMGSADYRSAGAMRPIFSRVVSENLTEQARQVRCPTLLLYGDADTETPAEMGRCFQALIPSAQFILLEGFGHLTILTEGRHQLALRIRTFLNSLT